MQDCLKDGSSCFQYTDDTTVLHHATPKDLDVCVDKMKKTLSSIKSWAADNNLLLNETDTKHTVISTKQMSKMRNPDGYTPPLTLKDKTVDRVKKFKLLDEVTSSCYKMLATLRKIKNMTSQEAKKSLFKASCYPNLTLMTPSFIPFPNFRRKEFNAFRMLPLASS